MRSVLLATTILAFAFSTAQAADIVTEQPQEIAPVEPARFGWDAFYVGIQGGAGWGSDNNNVSGDFVEDLSGGFGGVHVGLNWQSGAFVYGVEADVEAAGLDADIEAGGDEALFEIDALASIRGRLGVAFDRFLIYGTAGLAWVNATYEISNGTDREDFDASQFGLTVGVGGEWMFTDNLSARLEWRYYDLGDDSFPSALFPGDTFTADYEFHTVRAGVSWHF